MYLYSVFITLHKNKSGMKNKINFPFNTTCWIQFRYIYIYRPELLLYIFTDMHFVRALVQITNTNQSKFIKTHLPSQLMQCNC